MTLTHMKGKALRFEYGHARYTREYVYVSSEGNVHAWIAQLGLKTIRQRLDGEISWAKKNRAHVSRNAFRQRLCHYGITSLEYAQMAQRQKGVCAICGGKRNGGKRLFIDHDHLTKKVRGLLCYPCNTMLGRYEKYRAQIDGYLA